MSEQYAGLSLGVDVSQVNNAVKSLKQFKQANDQAAEGVKSFVNEEFVARQKTKDLSGELSRQRKQFASVQSAIDPTAEKMRKLSAAASDLDKLWKKGAVPDEQFFQLGEILESQMGKLQRAKAALTEEGRAAIEEAKAKEKVSRAGKQFIADLEAQANAIGKTRAELLEIKAAQLGVSAQAAPFIQQMRSQEKQMKLNGISAAQYSQAMRMLPMQITDVVTSLASGMPVWMVAVQQGGQIKDSFGGLGNTFKVLLQFLTPMRVAVGGLVGILGAFAKAGYDAYAAQRDLNNAIILTGGYASESATGIREMTDALAGTSLAATVKQINEIAVGLVKTGKYTKGQIKEITAVTADWAAITGESSEKIIGYFESIAKDPVQGLADLNEQFNFLEKGQLTYINTLKNTQGETAAVTKATEMFGETMQKRIQQVYDSATPLEKMWMNIKQWASDAWHKVGLFTLTAGNLIADAVMGMVNQIRLILAQGDKMVGEFLFAVGDKLRNIPGIGESMGKMADEQKAIVEQATADIKRLSDEVNAANTRMSDPSIYKKMAEQQSTMEAYTTKTKEAIKKEAEAIKESNKAKSSSLSVGTRLLDQYEQDVMALKVQLHTLKEHRDVNDKISQQRKNLWNTEARFAVLEKEAQRRKLTADEQSELANKEKILALRTQAAEIGDMIQKEEQLIKREQEASKFLLDQAAKIAEIRAKESGQSDRDAGRTAEIERLKADWLSKGGSLEDKAFGDMMATIQQRYAVEDGLRANWLAGTKRAWAEYAEDATNVYGNVQNIASSALNGLTDMMTSFLSTGKANFKDFASSIIGMIIKMIAQMVIFNSLSGMMGGKTMSFASMFGGKGFAGGGYTGDGGKYDPAGIVHKGEFVFTKEATQRIGAKNLYRLMRGYANGGSVGGSVYSASRAVSAGSQFSFGDINVDINNGNDPRGLESGVRMLVTEMLQRSCSQGGEIYNFVNSKRG